MPEYVPRNNRNRAGSGSFLDKASAGHVLTIVHFGDSSMLGPLCPVKIYLATIMFLTANSAPQGKSSGEPASFEKKGNNLENQENAFHPVASEVFSWPSMRTDPLQTLGKVTDPRSEVHPLGHGAFPPEPEREGHANTRAFFGNPGAPHD